MPSWAFESKDRTRAETADSVCTCAGAFSSAILFGVEDDVSAVVGLIPLGGVSALVRESVDFTVTPRDWLTLAAGPMFSWGISEHASALGSTLRVDFHFPHARAAGGARRAWTLGLAGDLGGVLDRDGAERGVAWGLFLTFGYAWY